MKKAISLFIAATIILLALCSCGAYETVEASTIFKEYNLDDVNFEDADQAYEILRKIYNEKDYLITPLSNSLDYIYVSYSILYISDDRAVDGGFTVDVYNTAKKAREDYEIQMEISIPQEYKYGIVRINNLLLSGSAILMRFFLQHYGLDEPVVRNVRKDVIKKSYNKEIDINKLLYELHKRDCNVYLSETGEFNEDGEEYIDYTIISADGISLLGIKSGDNISIEKWFDIYSRWQRTAGTLVQYNNLSFVFLDDFWLDIIKQCEK